MAKTPSGTNFSYIQSGSLQSPVMTITFPLSSSSSSSGEVPNLLGDDSQMKQFELCAPLMSIVHEIIAASTPRPGTRLRIGHKNLWCSVGDACVFEIACQHTWRDTGLHGHTFVSAESLAVPKFETTEEDRYWGRHSKLDESRAVKEINQHDNPLPHIHAVCELFPLFRLPSSSSSSSAAIAASSKKEGELKSTIDDRPESQREQEGIRRRNYQNRNEG